KDFRQRYARLTAQKALIFVKRDETSQVTHIQGHPTLVQAAITVTPSIRVGQHRLLKISEIRQFTAPENRLYLSWSNLWIAPPGARLIRFTEKRHMFIDTFTELFI